MGLLFPQKPDPPRPRWKRSMLWGLGDEEDCCTPFRRTRSEPAGEFAPADRSIETLFATLQCAWRQHDRHLERQTWTRLMMRLKELPPLRN
jgi:hypothetical protein